MGPSWMEKDINQLYLSGHLFLFFVVVVLIAESKVLKLWNTKSQFSLSGGSEPK